MSSQIGVRLTILDWQTIPMWHSPGVPDEPGVCLVSEHPLQFVSGHPLQS